MGINKLTQEEECNVIVDYQNSILTCQEISKKYNISVSTINKILRRHGIAAEGSTKRNRRYYFNEHYLDTIDTEEKAYFLGFIYADGNHNEARHSLTINICKEDEPLLKKFYEMFNSDREIYYVHNKPYNKYYARFCLQSKHLSTQLLNLGIMGNKTFKIIFPTFIPQNLIRHFIRGYFDGDGCIGLSKRGWKSTCVELVSNETFIESIRQIIESETGKTMKLYKKTNSGVYELKASGIYNVYAILNYLYKDCSIYLQRKYNRYIDFITQYEGECFNNE